MSSASVAPTLHGVSTERTRALELVLDEVSYATRELWRSRIVLVFTFVLPLAWLLIIGTIAGTQIDPNSGAPIMQFVTPAAALMGILFAAYPPVARSLAEARERRLMKRIEGTPLPMGMYLVGRMGGALILALSSILFMFAVGFLFYDVHIIWRTLPATVATMALSIASFSALGLAVGSIAPSASSAQSFAVASALVVSFLSGLFTLSSTQPAWMTSVGNLFPPVHVLDSLWDQFSPALGGSGWELDHLAVIGLWGVAGLVIARWGLRREPVRARSNQALPSEAEPAAQRSEVTSLEATRVHRPTTLALTIDQISWSIKSARRDVGWVLFALAMPVALYAFMTSLPGNDLVHPHGMSFAFYFACGMTVYGIGVTAFMDVPAAIAALRDRLVLKRLRGTPLAPLLFMTGRSVAVLVLAIVTAVLIFLVGAVLFEVTIGWPGLPVALLVLLLGATTLAACGYALACLVPNARAVAVVGLAILLPLSFLSDIFVLGTTPDWFATVASLFPLQHFVHALAGSLNPSGVTTDSGDLLVMAVWLVVAGAFAVRRWRWEPAH